MAGQHVASLDDYEVIVVKVQQLLQRTGYRVSGQHRAEAALQGILAAPRCLDFLGRDHNIPESTGMGPDTRALPCRKNSLSLRTYWPKTDV